MSERKRVGWDLAIFDAGKDGSPAFAGIKLIYDDGSSVTKGIVYHPDKRKLQFRTTRKGPDTHRSKGE